MYVVHCDCGRLFIWKVVNESPASLRGITATKLRPAPAVAAVPGAV